MNAKERGRRRFLKGGAALAGLAVGGIRPAIAQTPGAGKPEVRTEDLRAYGERSRFENSIRVPRGGKGWVERGGYIPHAQTPLQDSKGMITPSSLHFEAAHGATAPDIDPGQHRLLIHGLVDRPMMFTMEELERLPSVSRMLFLECAGNGSPLYRATQDTIAQTHGRTSCSEWTGVSLSLLLQHVGLQKGATWLVAEGAEPARHMMSIPLEKAMDDIIVAYGQNGEALRPDNGYPVRLVLPGWEGTRSVKWLRRIKAVDQPYMAKHESAMYSDLRLDGKARWFRWEMPVKSVITFPSGGGRRLPGRGFYEIRGLAWSGAGAIRRVEVSTDGGRTWKDAQLQEPVLRFAHARFRFPWNWDGQEAVIQSRATDERGTVQPTLAQFGEAWGATVDYFKATTNPVGHFNVIQPWKVSSDGSILNALYL